MQKNKRLTKYDLSYARPAQFFHANQIKKVINKKLKKEIKSGMMITKKYLINLCAVLQATLVKEIYMIM